MRLFFLWQDTTRQLMDTEGVDPSRWDQPTPAMVNACIPLSAGRQSCIRRSLADAEINTIISQICGKFELELIHQNNDQGNESMKYFHNDRYVTIIVFINRNISRVEF